MSNHDEPVAWCTQKELENMAKGFSQDVPARAMRIPQSYPAGSVVKLYTRPQPSAPDIDHDATIRERDDAEAIADALAEKIAAITGCEIGEHTSANSPWHGALDAADEFLAHQQAAPAIPEGWKLVPVEPTDEMLQTAAIYTGGRIIDGPTYAAALYSSMLAAAPQQKDTP